MPATAPAWILTEPVELTLISCDPELVETVILVARTTVPGAVALTFSENRVLLNGLYVDLGEDLMAYCSLSDELLLSPVGETVGASVRSEPYEDQAL